MDVLRLSRRRFLAGAGAAGAVGWTAGLWTPARALDLRRTVATVADPAGTTLEATVVPLGAGPAGYRRLGEGPGWPIVVREELAAVVHLTDIHVVDAQSPGRVEFLDRYADPPLTDLPFSSAYRPQETMTVQVAAAMVRRVNSIGRGPVTGRSFDSAVSTGDNIDNQQLNEMQWFLTVLDGGTVVPDSGAPGVYEGVQDAVAPDPHYWHPDPGIVDLDKTERGFPDYPGLLAAAITGFDSPGLDVPWYSVYGNHDGLLQGNVNGVVEPVGLRPLDPVLTGSLKITGLPAGITPNDVQDAAHRPRQLRHTHRHPDHPVGASGGDAGPQPAHDLSPGMGGRPLRRSSHTGAGGSRVPARHGGLGPALLHVPRRRRGPGHRPRHRQPGRLGDRHAALQPAGLARSPADRGLQPLLRRGRHAGPDGDRRPAGDPVQPPQPVQPRQRGPGSGPSRRPRTTASPC